MPRRKKKPQPQPLEPLVPRFAFGKFRGRTVDEVMQVESSYLAWFMGQVDGCEELKETIKSHPRFSAVWKSYQECRRRSSRRRNGSRDSSRRRPSTACATSCSTGRKLRND